MVSVDVDLCGQRVKECALHANPFMLYSVSLFILTLTRYVLHDVPGLVSLFPSPEAYDAALEDFFVQALQFEVRSVCCVLVIVCCIVRAINVSSWIDLIEN